jgi:hypothetical protein
MKTMFSFFRQPFTPTMAETTTQTPTQDSTSSPLVGDAQQQATFQPQEQQQQQTYGKQHIPCRNGRDCMRLNCFFGHPEGRVIDEMERQTAQQCKYLKPAWARSIPLLIKTN